jgi:hypothetical protein
MVMLLLPTYEHDGITKKDVCPLFGNVSVVEIHNVSVENGTTLESPSAKHIHKFTEKFDFLVGLYFCICTQILTENQTQSDHIDIRQVPISCSFANLVCPSRPTKPSAV